MGSFSIWHWLIVLLIVILVFGTKKLRNLGQDLGSAIRGFKEGMKGGEEAADAAAAKEASPGTPTAPTATASTATPNAAAFAQPSGAPVIEGQIREKHPS